MAGFLAVALVAGIGYLIHRQAEETLFAEYALRLNSLAIERHQTLTNIFRDRQEALHTLAQTDMLGRFAKEMAQAGPLRHPNFPLAHRLFRGILLVDPTGTRFVASGAFEGRPLSEYADDIAGARKGPWRRVEAAVAGEPLVLLGTGVEASDPGAPVVVLVLTSLTGIDEVMTNRLALGHSGESFLADRHGRVAIPRLRYPHSDAAIAAEAMKHCLAGNSSPFVLEPDYTGELTAMAYQFLPEIDGGCLMVHVRAEEVFASARLLRNRVLGLTGLALAMVLPVALLLGHRAGRRITRSEQQARRVAERYEDLMHTVDGIVWEADAATFRFTVVSRQAERLLGYPVEQWINEPNFWVTHLHPEDRDWAPAFCMEAVREKRNHQFEYRMLAAYGRAVWLRDYVTVVAEEGRPVILRGVMVDITDRKQAERRQSAQLAVSQVLAESDALGKAAPRLLQIVCHTLGYDLGEIWLVDREAGVLRCETIWHAPDVRAEGFVDRSQQMTFSPGVGLPGGVWASGEPAWVLDIVNDADFPRAPIGVQSLLHGAFAFPIKIKSGADTLGVVECFSRDIREPDKEVLLMMAEIGIKIGQFIERTRVEEAAHAGEERFRLAVDHAHDAIFCLDDGDQILWANRRAETLAGVPMEELIGRPLMAAFSSQPMAKSTLAALGRGKPVPPLLEFEVFREGGSSWMEVNVTNVMKNEDVIGRILVARDITERKQAEQQLRQADKLAALGTLLDGVAHELNNPLFVISGNAQMASEKIAQGRYEDLARNLASIQEATQRMTEIVQRVLVVSRGATRRSGPCDVNALLEQTLTLVGNDLTIHQIQARTAFQAGLPTVLADPQDLVQVFLALMTNARQAMAAAHGRGTLTVTTALVADGATGRRGDGESAASPRLRVSASGSDRNWVEVRVADDGPGIAPEQQARLFEPFSTAKQGGKGTGLGLPIAHRIVTGLQGTLTCESQVGQGATFIVRLPVTNG